MRSIRRCEDVKRVVAFAVTIGFEPEWTNGGHLKFSKPERKPVFFSGSPGDPRAYKNAISNLKKSERGVL